MRRGLALFALFGLVFSIGLPPARAQWVQVGPNLAYAFRDFVVRGNVIVVACDACGTTGTRPAVVSRDGGQTWSDPPTSPVGSRGGTAVVSVPERFVLGAQRLYLLTPDGTTWTGPDITSYPRIYRMFNEPTTRTLYRVGQMNSLAVSTDGGLTWTSRPIPIEGATFVHARGQTVIIGDHWRSGASQVSFDGGQTWKAAPADASYGFIAADGRLYLANNTALVQGTARLLRSSDQGATWTTIATAPNRGFFGQSNPLDHQSVIYAEGNRILYSASDQLYLSTDDGQTWQVASTGLPLESFSSAAVLSQWQIANGSFYVLRQKYTGVATGYGVYRRPLSELGFTGMGTATEATAAHASVRLAVAPSPARGATTVTATLAQPEAVRITVYDAIGRAVATLHDGPLPAGTHAMAWSEAAAPGVYVVRLETSSAVVTKRVVRIR